MNEEILQIIIDIKRMKNCLYVNWEFGDFIYEQNLASQYSHTIENTLSP